MLVFPVRLGRNCLEEMRDVSNLNVLRIFLGCFRDVFGFGQLPGFVPGDFFLSVSWYRSPIKPPFGRRFFVFFPRHIKQIQEYEGYFRDLFTLNVGKSWKFDSYSWMDSSTCNQLTVLCESWLSNWMTGWPFFIFFMFPTNWEMLRDEEIPEFLGKYVLPFFKHRRSRSKSRKKCPFGDIVFWGQVGVYFNTY